MDNISVQSQVLVGWKDIAKYLNMGVRTVQRYECEHELPIRRPAAGVKGAVIATKAELNLWVAARPRRQLSSAKTLSPLLPDSTLEPLGVAILRNRQLRTVMRQRRADVATALAMLDKSIRLLGATPG